MEAGRWAGWRDVRFRCLLEPLSLVLLIAKSCRDGIRARVGCEGSLMVGTVLMGELGC